MLRGFKVSCTSNTIAMLGGWGSISIGVGLSLSRIGTLMENSSCMAALDENEYIHPNIAVSEMYSWPPRAWLIN